MARHGYAGATIAAVAEEAGLAPGLVHHHFVDKEDLLASLLTTLVARFRSRVHLCEVGASPLDAYLDAALKLDADADLIAARCWVGIVAEAVRTPALFAQLRRFVDGELFEITRRSEGALAPRDASALLAFVMGALVMGAFAPRHTAGFARPAAQRLARRLPESPRT